MIIGSGPDVSISPPSDIVLDVAQAADPTRLQAATAKLARMATGGEGDGSFATALGSAEGSAKPSTISAGASSLFGTLRSRAMPAMTPYQKFEALMLQNMLQNILPKDEELFGDAASADISRSMLAEQVANQIAKTGRLGIAKMIEHAHGSTEAKPLDAAGQLGAATPAGMAAAVSAADPGLSALSTLANVRLIKK